MDQKSGMMRKTGGSGVVVVVIVGSEMLEPDGGGEDGRRAVEGEGVWGNERKGCESVWFVVVW